MPREQYWQPLHGLPPVPSGVYAGIGATIVDQDWGQRAIHELYVMNAGATREPLVVSQPQCAIAGQRWVSSTEFCV